MKKLILTIFSIFYSLTSFSMCEDRGADFIIKEVFPCIDTEDFSLYKASSSASWDVMMVCGNADLGGSKRGCYGVGQGDTYKTLCDRKYAEAVAKYYNVIKEYVFSSYKNCSANPNILKNKYLPKLDLDDMKSKSTKPVCEYLEGSGTNVMRAFGVGPKTNTDGDIVDIACNKSEKFYTCSGAMICENTTANFKEGEVYDFKCLGECPANPVDCYQGADIYMEKKREIENKGLKGQGFRSKSVIKK